MQKFNAADGSRCHILTFHHTQFLCKSILTYILWYFCFNNPSTAALLLTLVLKTHIFGGALSSKHSSTSKVSAVPGITWHHHVLTVKHLVRYLCDCGRLGGRGSEAFFPWLNHLTPYNNLFNFIYYIILLVFDVTYNEASGLHSNTLKR